jgi:hypothetical protein
MRSRQAGITFIGWVVLLVPLAIVAFAGLKLAPIYLNHMKVVSAMEQTAQDNQGQAAQSSAPFRRGLENRFSIEDIVEPEVDAIVVERDGDEWVMIAEYDRETSLIGNVALTVHFSKRVVVE